MPLKIDHPQIDLEPEDYRVLHKGRWIERDAPKHGRLGFFLSLAFLVLFLIAKDPATSWRDIGGFALFSFFAGIGFAIWTRDIY